MIGLARDLGALSVRGNHDDAALFAAEAVARGEEPPKKHAWVADCPERASGLRAGGVASDPDLAYLAGLPFSLALPHLGVLIVHAGEGAGRDARRAGRSVRQRLLARLSCWGARTCDHRTFPPLQRRRVPRRRLAQGLLWSCASKRGPSRHHCKTHLRHLRKPHPRRPRAAAGLLPGVPLDQQPLAGMYKMRDLARGPGSSWRWIEKEPEAGEDAAPWAKCWRGPSHVFFGHDAKRRLQHEPHATGLDTGCVYGGALTAAVLPAPGDAPAALARRLAAGEGPSFEDLGATLVSVDAARDYAPKKDKGEKDESKEKGEGKKKKK